jgi:hypothetical protein
MAEIQAQIEDTTDVMRSNLQSLAERGESIQTLEGKTSCVFSGWGRRSRLMPPQTRSVSRPRAFGGARIGSGSKCGGRWAGGAGGFASV